tara:strand:- start:1938 stop:2159 length:222 start_codon:yes stop_codon:yes gene_type:complete
VEYNQELYEKSLYYRHIVDECGEIDKHKWIESEKLGKDIGKDTARWSWISHHKNNWHSHWIKENLSHLENKTE